MQCVICFNDAEKMCAVGECEHPVCMECSIRMRVLCDHNECPICRRTLNKVYFVEKRRPYEAVKDMAGILDLELRYGIVLENTMVQNEFDKFMECVCKKCEQPSFRTINEMYSHMRSIHNLYTCVLCAENLKVLPKEREFYTRKELKVHYDTDGKEKQSHRGHPACEFCGNRFYDQEMLNMHMRRHLSRISCSLCANHGIRQYYHTVLEMRSHYRTTHFLCEQEGCLDAEVASVFYTEEELQAHVQAFHEDDEEETDDERPNPQPENENSGVELNVPGSSHDSSESIRRRVARQLTGFQFFCRRYMSLRANHTRSAPGNFPSHQLLVEGTLSNVGNNQPLPSGNNDNVPTVEPPPIEQQMTEPEPTEPPLMEPPPLTAPPSVTAPPPLTAHPSLMEHPSLTEPPSLTEDLSLTEPPSSTVLPSLTVPQSLTEPPLIESSVNSEPPPTQQLPLIEPPLTLPSLAEPQRTKPQPVEPPLTESLAKPVNEILVVPEQTDMEKKTSDNKEAHCESVTQVEESVSKIKIDDTGNVVPSHNIEENACHEVEESDIMDEEELNPGTQSINMHQDYNLI